MFGLDQFILPPPLSVLISLLLIGGCNAIGLGLIRISGLNLEGAEWLRPQATILGALLLSLIVYPLSLAGFATLLILRIIGIFVIAISLSHIFLSIKTRKYFSSLVSDHRLYLVRSNLVSIKFFLIFLLISYFLFSLSPITDADSLEHHTGVALHILRTGEMPVTPEWFHSRLTGSGEALNAVGFAMGAEQFGSLLQFMGLLGIFSILYLFNRGAPAIGCDRKIDEDWRVIVCIAALSAPVLIALVGSVKPQLLAVSMTTLAIAIVSHTAQSQLEKTVESKLFFLVCLLAMAASQTKFNYLLGGGVAGLLGLFIMYRHGLMKQASFIGVFCAIVVLLPPTVWKKLKYGGNFFESFLTNFQGNWPGTHGFEKNLHNAHDTSVNFPFSLVIPSGIETITTVLGIGVFLLFLLRLGSLKEAKYFVVASVTVFVVTVIFGPSSSRSYLEPFFWLMIVLALQSHHILFRRLKRFIQYPLLVQAGITAAMCWYGIIHTVPGTLFYSARVNVMAQMANGYQVMTWVGQVLPNDSVLLSSHRSIGISPVDTVSLDWLKVNHLSKKDASIYLERIKERKVTDLLVIANDYRESKIFMAFHRCLDIEDVVGPGYGHKATRNPFALNRGVQYTAWIFPLRHEYLPDCFTANNGIGGE